uniref:AP-3 complex subunit beta n=1 Tax=Cyclopterus lumpus TaxID=8103 RepID=A0A8C2XKE4_CYCLU
MSVQNFPPIYSTVVEIFQWLKSVYKNISFPEKGSCLSSGRSLAPRGRRSCSSIGFTPFSVLRNEDLKEMLESNKESLKLEAMKRVVGLIAKGKNASELFPAVVKNVASKNIELKKLVYVYLVRYAEEQQDLALLSISTFQRALKEPNQFIRASALRVLSSIRVSIIVPIMMLAIKEASADMSPYVRKTAAHAIQKLYSLDPDQKEQLIEVIEKLLKDKSTLVAGSVVVAFDEVCPDRIDLIHKNYRKLCNLLVDVEEWGQVVIISMLTRYARTQFTSPWKEGAMFDEDNEKAFYESEEEKKDQTEATPYTMDPDHRLLLRNTKPLLQSRNTAVVMSVAQLYWHLAPKHEVNIVTKSLVRLLRSHREVQYIVLQNIATMSIQRKGMFEPFMKSFYVRSTDATHIKTLKFLFLRDSDAVFPFLFSSSQTYVKSQDKAFAAATIQAIGRCATDISEVTDTCLSGLVLLLSNRDETVVAESVVVIKKLLQTQPTQHSDIIKHMAKLFDNISVSMARASILWLMGEYCERVPKIAPDVLRKMAKTFTAEEDIVKLQTVNLAAKLYLTNSKQTKLLTQYILNLGKYDQSYDIRDRTRFVRQLIVPNEKSGALNKYARRILLAPKPAPMLESAFKDRDRFQLGTLSHSINSKATGYQELSDWPAVAPDQSVRNVEVVEPAQESAPLVGKTKKPKSSDAKFYSDDEEEKEEEASESGGSEGSSSSSSEGLSLKVHVVVTAPSFGPVKTHELLHHMTGKGLSAKYHFPRQPCLYQPSMVAVQVILANSSDHSLEKIHIGDRSPAGLNIHCFNTIERLEPEASVTVSMGIDFSDSTQAANFQLCTKEDQFSVSIQPVVGELLMPSTMSEQDFSKEQGKLLGMNETSATVAMATANTSSQAVSNSLPSSCRFAGRTVSSGALVLVSLELKESSALLTINTEKSVMASMLLRDLKQALALA